MSLLRLKTLESFSSVYSEGNSDLLIFGAVKPPPIMSQSNTANLASTSFCAHTYCSMRSIGSNYSCK